MLGHPPIDWMQGRDKRLTRLIHFWTRPEVLDGPATSASRRASGVPTIRNATGHSLDAHQPSTSTLFGSSADMVKHPPLPLTAVSPLSVAAPARLAARLSLDEGCQARRLMSQSSPVHMLSQVHLARLPKSHMLCPPDRLRIPSTASIRLLAATISAADRNGTATAGMTISRD
jgi:hypothetical protein